MVFVEIESIYKNDDTHLCIQKLLHLTVLHYIQPEAVGVANINFY